MYVTLPGTCEMSNKCSFPPCKLFLLTESHLCGDPWEHKASPSGPQLPSNNFILPYETLNELP